MSFICSSYYVMTGTLKHDEIRRNKFKIRCIRTKAMRNCFFTLLRLMWNSGLPDFRMTEINL